MNRILANARSAAPTVGMGATQVMHSDRHAFTVVEIITPKKIKVRQDKATRTDDNGQSESQTYTYEPDPNGSEYIVTQRKSGRWVVQGDPDKNGQVFLIGERDEHYDYSF